MCSDNTVSRSEITERKNISGPRILAQRPFTLKPGEFISFPNCLHIVFRIGFSVTVGWNWPSTNGIAKSSIK